MTPKTNVYLTGGAVRDYLMRRGRSKDLDFAVEADSFEEMKADLTERFGLVVWQERPEFVTLRGRATLPPGLFSPVLNHEVPLFVDADFTLCRKEVMYSDLRHPDTVTPTDLATDLERRDFTVNAVAVSEGGYVFDFFNGVRDAELMMLRTVGNATARFTEDPLRMLRALRFSVTHNMHLAPGVSDALHHRDTVKLLRTVPTERVYEELTRAARVDWARTVLLLASTYPLLRWVLEMHHPSLWLKPTMEER